jgi:hypothetical protein
MEAVLIIAGLALVYLLIESKKTPTAVASVPTGYGGVASSAIANESTEGQMTGLEIGSGVAVGTATASSLANAAVLAGNLSQSAASAIPVIGAAISAVANILIAQHTARLKGATSENQALDQIIPAFDADISQIADAFNAGTLNGKPFTSAMATAGLAQVDAQIYAYLKGQVGPPGTAWDGSGTCSKSCTTGCCVYYNNLHSAIYGPSGAPYNGNLTKANGATGLIPAVQSSVPTSCYIPEVFPPSDTAYGNYTRAGYHIAIIPPSAAVLKQNTGVLSTLGL